ncbi:hypothetical protein V2J09_018395 [Rumex salicifolius]
MDMFFGGYGYHGASFEQTYRCYPASFIDKPQLESGDKIIMPPSALDRLASLHIDYPMLFELQNNAASRTSHCGVLEFIAEEGMIYMPYWMMENMLLQEGDTVLVKNATLPKGTYVKLQPHTTDFLDISNPKAILETTLRSFSCLTTGDSIMVAYNNKRYYIDIIETKPSHAISIIETDCEVDFAPPLDYKEPEKIVAPAPFKAPAPAEEAPPEEPKFNPFSGAGRRLDGKPGKNLPTPTATSVPREKPLASTSASGQSAAGSSSQSSNRQTQGKLVFGSKVNQVPKDSPKAPAKESKQEKEKEKEEPKFQPFTGKKYSLKADPCLIISPISQSTLSSSPIPTDPRRFRPRRSQFPNPPHHWCSGACADHSTELKKHARSLDLPLPAILLVFVFKESVMDMFFGGYGYHGASFEQTYRCYPASFIGKPQLESGDKIIMPPSALDRLASLHIDYPMLFELQNNAASRTSHCGVLEFIAEEGMIYMPYWMMENMLLQEGDTVLVKNATLPKGTYVKLQPHTTDFLDISNPKAILETTLRSFSCLTTGDSIMVAYNNKRYYIDIVETKPSNAISIIETDCEVDFAPPLDYKEPEKIVAPAPFKAPAPVGEAPPEEPKFNPFSGAGKRLDGKPSKSLPTPTATSVSREKPLASTSASGQSAAGSSSQSSNRQTQGKLVFGSKVNQTPKDSPKAPAKESKQEKEKEKEEPKFQPFTGKKYSLK